MTTNFQDLILERGNKRVVWEWIGEGWNGDYDENDPEDTPLLRFSCDQKIDGEWEPMEDASYCTRMPINSPKWKLEKGAKIIMDAIQDCCYKRRLEELSWFCPKDFS